MAALSLGGTGAAVATAWASSQPGPGLALAALSFLLVGVGVGAAGTSVLAMLARRVAPRRRAAAATVVWVMMITGFVLTAPFAGHFLDPFSNARLIGVIAAVSGIAFVVACLGVWGVEGQSPPNSTNISEARARRQPFRAAFAQVWAEPAARQFTIFIFVSMLAYSAQELLVEPFAGLQGPRAFVPLGPHVMELISDRWIAIIVAAASVTLVAVLGGLLTDIGPWYESLRFPSFRPPNWVFGPAWTVIFLLVASSGVMAWERASDGSARAWLIGLFAINGVLNVLWSALFFKFRRPDWAMFELVVFWLSIFALQVFIARISGLAAAIFAPYLLWVTFAGWLNLRVVQLNSPFGE